MAAAWLAGRAAATAAWSVPAPSAVARRALSSQAIRDKFLTYFEERGHVRVPSSSLVPVGDPSLLFTNAGMVQFKDYFLGEPAPYDAAVTVQRCMRAGGKHNDLDNVGFTPRHHTLFEMLGNFSFGRYFKEQAIVYGWDFLTRELRLPTSRLRVTILEGDEESHELWRRVVGLPDDRIVAKGPEDNFWSMGDGPGPCGPCTEIYWDRTPGDDSLGDDRWLELWNLVFMQNQRLADGSLTPLARPCVDTGMGLERVASVLQGQDSNYGIDTFAHLIASIHAQLERLGRPKPTPSQSPYIRIIADHLRACSFLIADGVLPSDVDCADHSSNVGRGYVLRRILRRAVNAGRELGFEGPFLQEIFPALLEASSPADRVLLTSKAGLIDRVLHREQAQFLATLDRGLQLLQANLPPKGSELPGEVAFRLFDTYGFPLDLTEMVARRAGCTVDLKDAERLMEAQRERSRTTWAGSDRLQAQAGSTAIALPADVAQGWAVAFPDTRFVGDCLQASQLPMPATVKAIHAVSPNHAFVLLDESPFYGRGGGQVGDMGWLDISVDAEATPTATWTVVDTTRPIASLTVLEVRRDNADADSSMELAPGTWVRCRVDLPRRQALEAHHTATHILHAALRQVLGTEGLAQAGSLVEPDRLRFDFTHPTRLTSDELRRVQESLNAVVRADLPVRAQHEPLEDATGRGALALFSDKYGTIVRTVEIPGVSLELCGGTHVERTGVLHPIILTSETAVAAGVRRIEAVTGAAAVEYLLRHLEILRSAAATLQVDTLDQVAVKATKLQEARSALSRQVADVVQALAEAPVDAAAARIPQPTAVPCMVHCLPGSAPPELLRQRGATVRKQHPKAVHLLWLDGGTDVACSVGAGASTVVAASAVLASVLQRLGGKGGGQREWAQGRFAASRSAAEITDALAAGVSAAAMSAPSKAAA